MPNPTDSPAQQWRRIIPALKNEIAGLSRAERQWIELRLAKIGALQEKMHALFVSVDGMLLCRSCLGQCCGCGKNHLTLTNILAFLVNGEEPPSPDFSRNCPYLGDEGCLFEVARRPYNCVSFLCEQVEERLAPGSRDAFYRLEKGLRAIYLQFDARYAGSSLRGIFIRAERLSGIPFLSRP